MVRVSVNLCVVCPRPPGHPTGAAPKILQKISRAPWAEGTFERNRDTRDFAHFSHLQRDLKPVASDFSCFFVFTADFSDQRTFNRVVLQERKYNNTTTRHSMERRRATR